MSKKIDGTITGSVKEEKSRRREILIEMDGKKYMLTDDSYKTIDRILCDLSMDYYRGGEKELEQEMTISDYLFSRDICILVKGRDKRM